MYTSSNKTILIQKGSLLHRCCSLIWTLQITYGAQFEIGIKRDHPRVWSIFSKQVHHPISTINCTSELLVLLVSMKIIPVKYNKAIGRQVPPESTSIKRNASPLILKFTWTANTSNQPCTLFSSAYYPCFICHIYIMPHSIPVSK